MKNSDDSRHVDISNMTKFQPKSDTNEKQKYPFTWESESREVLLHLGLGDYLWLTDCLSGRWEGSYQKMTIWHYEAMSAYRLEMWVTHIQSALTQSEVPSLHFPVIYTQSSNMSLMLTETA